MQKDSCRILNVFVENLNKENVSDCCVATPTSVVDNPVFLIETKRTKVSNFVICLATLRHTCTVTFSHHKTDHMRGQSILLNYQDATNKEANSIVNCFC